MVNLPAGIRNGIEEKHFINKGKDDEMEVIGYRKCLWYEITSWCATIISFGFLGLVFKWMPRFHLWTTHRKCQISIADKLLVIEKYQKTSIYHIAEVKDIKLAQSSFQKNAIIENNGYFSNDDTPRDKDTITIYFDNGCEKDLEECRKIEVKKFIYIWDSKKNEFLKLSGLGLGLKNSELHSSDYLSKEQHRKLKLLFGENDINVPVQSYLDLFIEELTSPYYIYQTFCYIFWLYVNYYTFAATICLWTFGSIVLSVYQIHEAQTKLNEKVHAHDTPLVYTMTSEGVNKMAAVDLVPGNMVIIKSNSDHTMPCDAVLLSGSCIVNESMLTGESMPLTKTALPKNDKEFQEKECSMHILYSGTKIIQTRKDDGHYVLALVIRTGYSTVKGKLVRSILYSPPVDYIFENGVYSLIYIVAAIGTLATAAATAGMVYEDVFDDILILNFAISLLTIVLPAALPGAMTITKVYVVNRLKNQNIFCINSNNINLAGTVNCVCFDKTGTLTEDGLDIWGVVPAKDGLFLPPVTEPKLLENDYFKYALATCHSLSIIDEKVCGDPLDIKMLDSTGWIFNEPESESATSNEQYPSVHSRDGHSKIHILHQNQFMSDLQRMSVVCQHYGSSDLVAYCKGSPEIILSLSNSSSVPTDFTSILETYTTKGYRVIGLGWKNIDGVKSKDLREFSRDLLESNLDFLGLLILENRIKVETFNTIQILKKGLFKIVVITGDNLNTAICVSRDCDIVSSHEDLIEIQIDNGEISWNVKNKGIKSVTSNQEEDFEKSNALQSYKLVLTGSVWEELKKKHYELIPKIVVNTAVFARMSSEQKFQVVLELQNLGYSVIMCGDGANDCGALKTANVGVSLSDEESSVASPFTSVESNISCVPKIIKEGRAGLIASFGLIKFLIVSSLIEFTWTSVCILVLFTFPTSSQYIYTDIFINIHLSLYFGLTAVHEGDLVPDTPITSILSISPILSMIVHYSIMIIIQFLSLYILLLYSWYRSSSDQIDYQPFAVYAVTIFQYIILTLTFSQDYPYIQPIYKNKLFIFGVIIMTITSLFVVLGPIDWMIYIFDFVQVPSSAIDRLVFIPLTILNIILCIIFEKIVIEKFLFKRLKEKYRERNKKTIKYIEIEEQTSSKNWFNGKLNFNTNTAYRNDSISCYDNKAFSMAEHNAASN